MIYLSDNDIVEKLATCDLLDDALVAFNATRNDVRIIPTLKYRIGIGTPRAKVVRKRGPEVVARLVDFIGSVREITEFSQEDQLMLESLDDNVKIDPGEIILLSATAAINDYLLFTGDKRCLKAVATTPECSDIARRIQGKVVCFEQIIFRIIDAFGFEHVRAKVVPVMHVCDIGLRAAFGSGMQATLDNVLARLESDIAEIRCFGLDLLAADSRPLGDRA